MNREFSVCPEDPEVVYKTEKDILFPVKTIVAHTAEMAAVIWAIDSEIDLELRPIVRVSSHPNTPMLRYRLFASKRWVAELLP
jgi:hypothetical protein